VQARAVWDRTDCSTYILRPQVIAGPSASNYLFDGLRGAGSSLAAQPSRAPRSTFILPLGRRYLETPFQFVHVDDMARLIAFILRRPDRGARLTILNVAGRGEPVRMRDCVKISGTRLLRIPFRRLLNPALKLANRLGNKAVAPDAAAYMTGTHLLDTGRLRAFLGTEYERVIHYSNERALRDSFWDIRAEQPAAAYARRSAAN
jgi:nucleoside-diphosphate-sugar epimerase